MERNRIRNDEKKTNKQTMDWDGGTQTFSAIVPLFEPKLSVFTHS